MAIQPFSDPELYVLDNWARAVLFEGAMKAVRDKYATILGNVLDEVQKRYKELKIRGVHPNNEEFNIGVGKAAWPSTDSSWPSGLWIGRIRVENVMSDDEGAPGAGVWVNPPRDAALDMQQTAQRLRDAAQAILAPEEYNRLEVETYGKTQAWIEYELSEPRAKLRQLLLMPKANDFINCLVGHFETLAEFIPVMDEIARGGKQKHK